jgi:hypothetical protein
LEGEAEEQRRAVIEAAGQPRAAVPT